MQPKAALENDKEDRWKFLAKLRKVRGRYTLGNSTAFSASLTPNAIARSGYDGNDKNDKNGNDDSQGDNNHQR